MIGKDLLKLKKRKHAALKVLLLSVSVTFMCFSMLVGTTYAWLTDSVTSSNNKVLSGTLDIDLYYYDITEGEWLEATGDIFEDIEWQPGAAYSRALEIRNKGDLPVNFAFNTNAATEYGSINTDGEQFFISDYLKVNQQFKDTAELAVDAINGTDALKEAACALTDFGFPDTELTESIDANASKYVIVTIAMPDDSEDVVETVDNVDTVTHKGVYASTTKSGMPLPKFDVRIVVTAVQKATADAFGNTTDHTPPTAVVETVRYQLDTTALLYQNTGDNGTYYINDRDDFDRFVSVVNKGTANGGTDFAGKTVKLTTDINLSTVDPLNNTVVTLNPWPLTGSFAGIFDGGYKATPESTETLSRVISGFTLDVATDAATAALFNLTASAPSETNKVVNISVNNFKVTWAADTESNPQIPSVSSTISAVTAVSETGAIAIEKPVTQ